MHVPCHQRFKAIKTSLLSRTCRCYICLFISPFFGKMITHMYLDGKKSSKIYRNLCSQLQLTPVVFWRKKSKMGDVTASTKTHTHPRFFRALTEASLLRFYFEVTTLASSAQSRGRRYGAHTLIEDLLLSIYLGSKISEEAVISLEFEAGRRRRRSS